MQTISTEVDMYLIFFPGYPADLEEVPNLPERVPLSKEKLKGCFK